MSSRPDISFEMFLKIRTDFDKFELKFWIVWKCGLKKERKNEKCNLVEEQLSFFE